MARGPRLQELGLPVHAIAQGMDRCVIHDDDYDRTAFVLRAAEVFDEVNVQVLAWALMDNHVHLVLRPTEGLLSKAMQRVLGWYAQRFNRRHRRVGRLYRDRFWSRPVEDDDDLLGLIGYVLLNPVRGGIVPSVAALAAYPWTSFDELARPPQVRRSLVDRAAVLSLFGQTENAAQRAILELCVGQLADDPEGRAFRRFEPDGESALRSRQRTDLRLNHVTALRLSDQRIDRVIRAMESATALRLLLRRADWTVSRVVERAAALCGAEVEMVRGGRRRRPESHARCLASHFGATHLGASLVDVAAATGVSRQAIGAARVRGQALAARRGLSYAEFFGVDDRADLGS